jgi:hypothetical protein
MVTDMRGAASKSAVRLSRTAINVVLGLVLAQNILSVHQTFSIARRDLGGWLAMGKFRETATRGGLIRRNVINTLRSAAAAGRSSAAAAVGSEVL